MQVWFPFSYQYAEASARLLVLLLCLEAGVVLVEDEDEDAEEAEAGVMAANEQYSFLRVSSSSMNICLHLHSTLQKAVSPLYI